MRRLLLIVAIAACASAVVGVLLGQWRDWSVVRSVVYGFYTGGAVLVAVALSQSGEARQADAGPYLAVGIIVLLLGMAFDVALAAT